MNTINATLSQMTAGQPEPHVGMGATILGCWSARHPATVVEVFQIGSKPAVAVTYDLELNGVFETAPKGVRLFFAFNGVSWDHYITNPSTGRPNKARGSSRSLYLGNRETIL